MKSGSPNTQPVTRWEAKRANHVIREASATMSRMLNGVYVRTDLEDLLIDIQDAVDILREYNNI
jgi:hypothetical protein